MYNYHLLKTFGISNLELAFYFLDIFCDSIIIICAFCLFLGCLLGCLTYLLFMKKNEQTQCSVLNVLHGNFAVFSIISSLTEFIDVIGQKFDIDNDNLILCSAFNIRKAIRVIYILLFIEVTISVVLYHAWPNLYLNISLIWKNKIGFLTVTLIGIFHLMMALQDSVNYLSQCIINLGICFKECQC